MAFGLYLHIPYCHAKCRYCDFYSKGGSTAVPDAYVDALLAALAAHHAPRPGTVYFGGGTPSLLTSVQVGRLLTAARPLPGAEITLEANPDSMTEEKLAGYLAAGVNRLSVGVQTARDDSLRRLGRLHTAAQSAAALAMARRVGFTNISGDLMLALPHYTDEELTETVALLTQGGVTHISAYLLKIEPGTPFGRNPPEGLPDDDQAADIYTRAVALLARAGYAQYEISNFARPGFESRHNLLYWDCEDYLGLGPSAHSSMGRRRFYYPSDTAAFLAGTAAEEVEGEATAEDYIMLQLRLARGLSLADLEAKWNTKLAPWQLARIPPMARAGLCTFDGAVLALTPKGMLVQNAVLGQLLFE